MLSYQDTPIVEIKDDSLETAGVKLLIKREDLNHPYVSGNKWWKLKYNLEEAVRSGHDTILTFGGAYSNHIYATAAATKEFGINSIGIIRGEETTPINPTLTFANQAGMRLAYVTREEYKKKDSPSFLTKLRNQFGNFYLIPEGGTNTLAVRGVEEFAGILLGNSFDYLCVPAGTGGTMAGLIKGVKGQRKVIGYSVLKNGEFLVNDVGRLLGRTDAVHDHWEIQTSYHHGGYAKVSSELLSFLKDFERQHNIPLDPVYTAKMMWGILQDIKQGRFDRNSVVLAIHTGGLQGAKGFL
jgi:1-aminocyclopropane-1-carboxylate deaminase/D-cysteine desulfhydrase-like pyridoxal-dependent ACC family enzyme